jgi:hypothetical protein
VLNVDFSGLTLCFYFEIGAICTEHPVLLMRVNFFIGLGQVTSLPVKEITISRNIVKEFSFIELIIRCFLLGMYFDSDGPNSVL